MTLADEMTSKFHLKELSPKEAYSWIFQLSEKGSDFIQRKSVESRDFKANPVGYFKFENREKGDYRILFKDTFFTELKKLQEADFAIINGITYFGRKNESIHASKMYAMIFDLDNVTSREITNIYVQSEWNFPMPNIIACSGHGIHLYYLFENPISLYPNTKVYLKELKYALTKSIWNKYTSQEEKVQYQGINQGFRVIGGKTKIEGIKVRAFLTNEKRFSLKDFDKYVNKEDFKTAADEIYKESKYTIEEAKKLYPEWYENLDNPHRKKGQWYSNRGLYDWWKGKILSNTFKVGHRYFSLMALAIYGIKCGISKEEVENDAYELADFYEKTKLDPKDSFSRDDAKSALECFDERYARFPRTDIEKLCDIRIDPNKRNGRTQEQHCQVMRAIQGVINPNWREGNGRKPKKNIVEEWQKENPTGKKSQCLMDTGLSRPTIDKYWN